jgi:hypothetical protein
MAHLLGGYSHRQVSLAHYVSLLNFVANQVARFLIPAAETPEQAESIHLAIAKFNQIEMPAHRIESITWTENGETVEFAVGKPFPASYGIGHEPVMAILEAGSTFLVCSASRGGLWGQPVVAQGRSDMSLACFS